MSPQKGLENALSPKNFRVFRLKNEHQDENLTTLKGWKTSITVKRCFPNFLLFFRIPPHSEILNL